MLDGEVSQDGYLFGIYHAESLHDKGIGNFFLEINIKGDMEGLWSGYDSIKKKIVSGRYSFTRIPNIKIKIISNKHVPAILNIAERQLGNAYINVEDLLNDKNIAIYASVRNNIVGFCTGKKMSLENLYKDIPQLADMKLKQLDAVENLGFLASVATEPNYLGRGVGSALIEYCITELENKELNVLVMTGWKSGKGVHIGGIAKKYNFEKLKEIPNFWKEDSIKNSYNCPSCGPPPCLCSAVVYIRHSKH